MTFGEHLEELRRALRGAVIWLAIGLAIGLYFATGLVSYVQQPLREAILTFQADREIARRNLDPKDKALSPLKAFLIENSFQIETVFLVPPAEEKAADAADAAAEKATAEKAAKAEKLAKADDATGKVPVKEESIAQELAAGEPESEIPDFIKAEQEDLVALTGDHFDPSSLQRQVTLRPSSAGLNSHKTEEGFMIWIKAGLMIGAVIASPMIFYNLWGFVAAGLYAHERQYVYIYLPFSVVLFASGVCLAFFVVLYYVLNFLLTFNAGMNVDIQPRLSYYMNFVLLLPLGFGVAFQLPLVMLFLERLGMFTVQSYISSWRIAILIICVASMILTPADVTSMVALAIPLIFLYFMGILMCKYIPRGRGLGSAALDPR